LSCVPVNPGEISRKEAFFTSGSIHMEHCRGSLVREGGSLESYWCPAPQEFKSLPRRKIGFVMIKKGFSSCSFDLPLCNINPIKRNELVSMVTGLVIARIPAEICGNDPIYQVLGCKHEEEPYESSGNSSKINVFSIKYYAW
jgi:hypothetical protein